MNTDTEIGFVSSYGESSLETGCTTEEHYAENGIRRLRLRLGLRELIVEYYRGGFARFGGLGEESALLSGLRAVLSGQSAVACAFEWVECAFFFELDLTGARRANSDC
jgi:hypothetical protein